MEINPFELQGPWTEGWALDMHSVSSEYLGDDPLGRAHFKTVRTELGEALYDLKYLGQTRRANEIAAIAVDFLSKQPWFETVDIIMPAPASKKRSIQPVFLIAQEVATLSDKFYADDALLKSDDTEAKNLSRDEKSQLVSSISFVKKFLRPCNALIIDDLCSSGKTLSDCVQALKKDPKTQNTYVLAITKTRTK